MKVKSIRLPIKDNLFEELDEPRYKMPEPDGYDQEVNERFSYASLENYVKKAFLKTHNLKGSIWHRASSCDKMSFKSKSHAAPCITITRTFTRQKDIYGLDKERQDYELNIGKYIKTYVGKYIALQNGIVLDSDVDFSKLATRVYGENGYKAVFMPFVTAKQKLKVISPQIKTVK